jgi:hypothetical protein
LPFLLLIISWVPCSCRFIIFFYQIWKCSDNYFFNISYPTKPFTQIPIMYMLDLVHLWY